MKDIKDFGIDKKGNPACYLEIYVGKKITAFCFNLPDLSLLLRHLVLNVGMEWNGETGINGIREYNMYTNFFPFVNIPDINTHITNGCIVIKEKKVSKRFFTEDLEILLEVKEKR